MRTTRTLPAVDIRPLPYQSFQSPAIAGGLPGRTHRARGIASGAGRSRNPIYLPLAPGCQGVAADRRGAATGLTTLRAAPYNRDPHPQLRHGDEPAGMRPTYPVTELLGDGIGPELSRAVHRLAEALPVRLDFVPVDFSLENRRARGRAIYDEAIESITPPGSALKHPTTTAEESPNAILRRRLDLSVIHRPVYTIPGVPTNFRRELDLDIVRIATGGTYDDPGRMIGEDGAVSLRIVERQAGHPGGAVRLQPGPQDRQAGHQLVEVHHPAGDRRPVRAGHQGGRRPVPRGAALGRAVRRDARQGDHGAREVPDRAGAQRVRRFPLGHGLRPGRLAGDRGQRQPRLRRGGGRPGRALRRGARHGARHRRQGPGQSHGHLPGALAAALPARRDRGRPRGQGRRRSACCARACAPATSAARSRPTASPRPSRPRSRGTTRARPARRASPNPPPEPRGPGTPHPPTTFAIAIAPRPTSADRAGPVEHRIAGRGHRRQGRPPLRPQMSHRKLKASRDSMRKAEVGHRLRLDAESVPEGNSGLVWRAVPSLRGRSVPLRDGPGLPSGPPRRPRRNRLGNDMSSSTRLLTALRTTRYKMGLAHRCNVSDCSCDREDRIHGPFQSGSTRVHPDRAARRHRHHRRVDRPAAPRRASGARGRPASPVHQQPQAARPGGTQLCIDHECLSRASRSTTRSIPAGPGSPRG